MSYAIPVNELTLTDIKNYKQAAIDAGVARAVKLGIASSAAELVAREALPFTDLGTAATGWTTEYYRTGAVAAATWTLVGNSLAAATLPVGRIAVFYKIADADANPQITAVRFMVGATGATTKGVFNIQLPLDNKLETDMYLSEPVVYDQQDILFIQCYARAAIAVAEELSFGCFIVERLGGTVS